MVGQISKYRDGVDLLVECKIFSFYIDSEMDGAPYCSPEFSFGGERWYLKIFPSGSSEHDSFGHVDLWLCKCRYGCFIKQSFSLSLKTVRGEKYNEQHCTKDFDNANGIHRFNRVIPKSELYRRMSELMPDGVLRVLCTMKNMTFATSGTGNDPEHACVGLSTQPVGAFTQHVETSIQTVEISTQTVEEKCEACASGSFTNPQENKVLHDFKELFFNKEDCDITINVKGSEFLAHRVILKARSPVLASTFRHDMKENMTGVLEIEDCDSFIFSDFLCFLYCGDVSIISQENVFGLFTAADKYQVLDLTAKCLEFIKKNITVATFCESLTLALRHSEAELIKLCTNYFKKNIPKIIVTVKWQTFLAENPTVSNELFVKSFVPNSN